MTIFLRFDRLLSTCLELVDIDYLQTTTKLRYEKNIYNGIRYDDEGVPVSYFVARQSLNQITTSAVATDFEEIPAFNNYNGTRKVFHLFRPVQKAQRR